MAKEKASVMDKAKRIRGVVEYGQQFLVMILPEEPMANLFPTKEAAFAYLNSKGGLVPKKARK